ncbi:putative translation elongation factor EF1B, gamma chain [Medicago truncatula]|uniref:Putative translation elongation factor EF1B, gamma chain n=1 Tax=Medicago truncatula TaxID=3880 RepID=A0A396IQI5_MEDTR|nr:putative translation elongation factor EF1B, gamma chain [Medicago truncatula]
MLVIGSEPPFKVKGLWLFRGQEIPKFVMDECYDMELYEWTKVDISDEAQKERVGQMIEDFEPFEGNLCWMPSASSEFLFVDKSEIARICLCSFLIASFLSQFHGRTS